MVGTPLMADRALVVSLHDVSPATLAECRVIMQDLAQAGIDRVSLLVIPDHHRRCPISSDEAFLNQLADWQTAGHEIVQHGYYHMRAPRREESIRQRAITRIYTAGEGEFYDLTYERASELLAQGRQALAAGNFEPVGFIAPAWLLGGKAERAVRDAGFAYTTRLGSVLRFSGNYCHRSQSLVYSVRSNWRVLTSLVWNNLLAASLTGNQLVRLGLHPPDWRHATVRRQALAKAENFAAKRTVTTYADWVQSTINA